MNAKEAKIIMQNYDISNLHRYVQDSIMFAVKSGQSYVICHICKMSESNLQKLLAPLYEDGYEIVVKTLYNGNYDLKISWA